MSKLKTWLFTTECLIPNYLQTRTLYRIIMAQLSASGNEIQSGYLIQGLVQILSVIPILSPLEQNNPIQIIHGILLTCCLTLLQSGMVTQYFHDLIIFEETRPGVLYSIPQFGLVWCFLSIKFSLSIFGRKNTEVVLYWLHPFRWYMVSICPTIGKINFIALTARFFPL